MEEERDWYQCYYDQVKKMNESLDVIAEVLASIRDKL